MAMNPRNPHLWQCITCGSCYDDKFVICFRCFTHRPPPRSGYPQIFAGCVFHFNGIIQRSLLNQSFNKEWRMAQAHGATCTSHYVPKAKDTKVTHLIYRTGYERSDKVRAAVHSGKIHVVPIEWMLDSMMQGARISEDTRSLKEIPSRSLPMDNSSYTLEHHRHAFYVAHQNNFPEPSPEAVAEAKALAQEEQRKRKPLGPEGHVMATSLPTVDATRPYRPVEPWPLEELTQAGSGSVARPLFPGLRFLFSESCPQNAALCAQKLGATIVASLTDEPTHVLYTEEDKKNSVVQNTIAHIERQCATSSMSGTFRKSPFSITLAPLLWLQDCIQGYELLPNSGPYIASARLVPSYAKKK